MKRHSEVKRISEENFRKFAGGFKYRYKLYVDRYVLYLEKGTITFPFSAVFTPEDLVFHFQLLRDRRDGLNFASYIQVKQEGLIDRYDDLSHFLDNKSVRFTVEVARLFLCPTTGAIYLSVLSLISIVDTEFMKDMLQKLASQFVDGAPFKDAVLNMFDSIVSAKEDSFIQLREGLIRDGHLEEETVVTEAFTELSLFKALAKLWTVYMTSTFMTYTPSSMQVALASTARFFSGVFKEMSLVEAFLEFTNVVSTNIRDFCESGNFMDLFGRPREIGYVAKLDVYKLLNAEMTRGIKPMGDIPTIIAEGTALIAEGRAIIKKDPNLKYLENEFPSVLYCITRLRSLMDGVREVPYGILMSGPPGCGKTEFINSAARIVGKTLNLPNSANIVVNYDMSATFQQYTTIPFVVTCNDAFSSKEEFLNCNVVDTLQSLVDSTPMNFNRASLSEKADSGVYPRLVIVNSNVSQYHTVKSVAADKLNRRYKVVEVSYTEECVKAADDAKVTVAEYFSSHYNEKGLILIKFGDAWCKDSHIHLTISATCKPRLFNSWEEFNIFFLVEYEKHLDRNKERLASHRDLQLCEFGIVLPHNSRGCKCSSFTPAIGYCTKGVALARHSECDCGMSEMLPFDGVTSESALSTFGPTRSQIGFIDSLWLGCFWLWVWSRSVYIPLKALERAPESLVALVSISAVGFIPQWFIAAYCWVVVYGAFDYRQVQYTYIKSFKNYWSFIAVGFILLWLNPFVAVLWGVPLSINSSRRNEFYAWTALCLLLVRSRCRKTFDVVLHYYLKVPQPADIVTMVVLLGGLIAMKRGYDILFKKDLKVEGNVFGLPLSGVTDMKPVTVVKHVNAHTARTWESNVNTTSLSRNGSKMHGTFLAPTLIATNRHFLLPDDGSESIMQDEEIHGVHEGFSFTFRYNRKLTYFVPDQDAVILYCAECKTSSRAREELVNVGVPALLRVNDVVVKHLPEQTVGQYGIVYERAGLGPGDCGKAIRSTDKRFLGIHGGRMETTYYGTKTTVSVAARITRNDMEAADLQFRSAYTIVSESLSIPVELMDMGDLAPGIHPRSDLAWIDVNMPCLGYKNATFTPTMSGKETVMYPLFGHKLSTTYSRPNPGHARLINGVWSSLYAKNVAGGFKTSLVRYDLLEKTLDYMGLSEQGDYPVGKISQHTAIVGHPDNVYMAPRDNSKSIGPYLQSMRVGMADAIKQVGDRYVVHPVLEDILERKRRLLSSGLTYLSIGKAVVKDELLPTPKVEFGGGRLFSVSCLSDILLHKEFFSNSLTRILADREIHNCYAGINCASPDEWRDLRDYISEGGLRILIWCLDQSKYDKAHGTPLFSCFNEFMIRQAIRLGMSPGDAEDARRFLRSRDNKLWILLEHVFHIMFSLLSGCADTIHANSIVHKILFLYTFLSYYLDNDLPFPSAKEVRHILRMALVGDDSLVSVPSAGYEWFNGELIVRCMTELGYTITAGDKSSIIEATPLDDMTFLKRKFRVEGEYVFAPLAEESIYKSLCYWIPGAVSEEERNASSLITAQYEFFMYGRERYEEFQRELDVAQVSVVRYTYDEVFSRYKDRALIPWVVAC